MPPKPAAAAKSGEDDAADQEKEFVEKELIISFLKTRLSRYGSSRSDCVSCHNTASQMNRRKHMHVFCDLLGHVWPSHVAQTTALVPEALCCFAWWTE